MRNDSLRGALLPLRGDDETAGAMRLTKRCENLLHLLRAARWLSTSQVHRRFFPQATADAARKRLRKLTQAGYLVRFREHRMSKALFTLGPEGKRVLEKDEGKEIILERKPPKQLEHFLAINDVRIAAELAGSLSYFFACWELPGAGWRYSIIPDAVFSMHNRTFAVEVDRGVETVRLFIRTKIPSYRKGLPGFPLTAILILTDRKARMKSLSRAIPHDGGRFLFTIIDLVREQGLLAPIFYRRGNGGSVSLF
jgi:Replication-relaxation